MKAKLLVVILLLVITSLGYAQKIDPEQVPKDVMIALEDQYTDFKVKAWKMVEGNYVATLTVEDQTGDATFTPEGKWLQTVFPIKDKELPSSMISYFDTRNKKKELKITRSELIEEAGKSYYIMRYNKKGVGQGKDIEVVFDVKGNFISTTGSDEELEADKVAANNEGEVVAAKTPNKPASSNSRSSKTPVKVKEEGVKKPAKARNETEDEEDTETTPATKAPADVPSTVKSSFTKKFPKAEEVQWEVTEDKTFKAKYVFREEDQEAEYDPEGNLMTVTSSINPDVLFRPIVNYLDKKYDKYKITSAQKVVYDRKYVQMKAPQKLKNFFIVEISQKVKRSKTPKITKLWFDQTGGLIKAEEPDEWGDEDYSRSKKSKQNYEDEE